MNIVVTERDKRLLRLVACVAILAIFGLYMIRPAITRREILQDEYDTAERKQQEYQMQNDLFDSRFLLLFQFHLRTP